MPTFRSAGAARAARAGLALAACVFAACAPSRSSGAATGGGAARANEAAVSARESAMASKTGAIDRAARNAPIGAPSLAPVFPHQSKLYAAEPGAPALFDLPGEARLRAVDRFGVDGSGRPLYLAWSQSDTTLRLLSADGAALESWELEAGQAWVSGSTVLARSPVHEADAGFAYRLYRVTRTDGPLPLAEATLDCFPSDVLFSGKESVWIAGADRADAAHTVYELAPGRAVRPRLSFPKRLDFARLVDSGDRVLVYASGADKAARALALYAFDRTGGISRELTPVEKPAGAACWYGSGFSFGGAPRLPLAMDDGTIAIASLERSGEGYAVTSIVRDSGGVYAPLGPDPSNAFFLYISFDYARDRSAYRLARYNGTTVTLDSLPR